MVEINWTRQAIEDIHLIREYYIPRSLTYADHLTDRFFEKARQSESHPGIGRIVPELQSPDISELIFKNYHIIYRVASIKRIHILTVHNSLRH